MKWILMLFLFFLPFHAVIITFMKCKLGIDTDILRFWKEGIVLFLLSITFIDIWRKYKGKIRKVGKDNSLFGVLIAFIVCSTIFIFFPTFEIKIQALLGFKYDVFFLFCLLIGLYCSCITKHFEFSLKTIFVSIGTMLVIFLPWFAVGNIETSSDLIGYNKTPSSYEANSCISFSQNVTGGHHRFQGSFGDPIRASVFLVVFFFIYLGYTLDTYHTKKDRILWIGIPLFLVFVSIFSSLTKTSMLGFMFGVSAFFFLIYTMYYKRKISIKFLMIGGGFLSIGLFFVLYIKRALFLHPEAILGRVENLVSSLDMFWHNPVGFGLGIAGPASQLATSTDTNLSSGVQKFLPENWYVQILLEQGIIGITLFLSIIIILGLQLWKIAKNKNDFFSIGLFVSFITILFMANFTHIFEESATSYSLFLIIGAYIAKESHYLQSRQRKKHKKA